MGDAKQCPALEFAVDGRLDLGIGLKIYPLDCDLVVSVLTDSSGSLI